MLRVGVIGAFGRMGSASCAAIEGDAELELAARIGRGQPLERLTERDVDVALELTTPEAAPANVTWCVQHGIHTVVGTSGVGGSWLEALAAEGRGRGANVLVAPNFALGAVIMMVLAARAAPYFATAEIVERHHDRKLDAPSGTALATAERMNATRGGAPWRRAVASRESLQGARGGDAGGVAIHSLRLAGSVAHQEVLLGSQGETLTIRHDSVDRSSFMPGLLMAVKAVPSRPGLTVGLEHLLDL